MLELTDIHCHLIPGVDDGAKDMETAQRMLRAEYKDGVRRIIVTPHYRRGMFETPLATVVTQFEALKKAAKELTDDLQLELGCEYHSNLEMVDNLLAGEQRTMAGSKYVLVEFSERHSFRNIWNQTSNLMQEGYQPIVAHIERYPCILDAPQRATELSEAGVMLQVNAGSLLGDEGFSAKRFARRLMKQELIDFVASDSHSMDC
ncbi:MAG: capsular biosynthesis protein [Clostridia bacterium]|nr:capsular biosynthesis protein [Clostridia bacterium]